MVDASASYLVVFVLATCMKHVDGTSHFGRSKVCDCTIDDSLVAVIAAHMTWPPLHGTGHLFNVLGQALLVPC